MGFWLRQRLRRQQVVVIGNIQPGQNTNGFRLMTYQTKFFLRINTKSGSEVCTYQAALGTWKYHVIIWHGDDVSVYVDNVPASVDKAINNVTIQFNSQGNVSFSPQTSEGNVDKVREDFVDTIVDEIEIKEEPIDDIDIPVGGR